MGQKKQTAPVSEAESIMALNVITAYREGRGVSYADAQKALRTISDHVSQRAAKARATREAAEKGSGRGREVEEDS